MEQVADLLRSYRHYHQNLDAMDTEEERGDCKKRAKVAEDTFRAMFQGRLESEGFLRHESEASALSTLRSWVGDMRPSHIECRSSTATLSDCSAVLMRLTSEQNSAHEPATWPYVRKIK